jgi:hypothetical protein
MDEEVKQMFRLLQQRMSAVEFQIGTIQSALGGAAQAVEYARALPNICGQCGEDLEGKTTCDQEACPIGYFTEDSL